ncbi:54S ribosomal protein L24, mitochondrial [Colletotrichum spaethianum]|uniref:54S ribosomal protein L24, mitochondrial n=1 Tax=Colletotrichum spaethianum TaxID=700344 RepID=A0AA37PFY2_9PEZI|nr:54S ribosomal protein L24, mitochondrial [Colletotrichum spaethianum]GKT51593.1 54S ribosomal protein L24, mitochondrial [Colletotrichum spaethianum]
MRFNTLRPGSSLLASLQNLTLTTTAAPSAARAFSTSTPLATKTISLQKLPSSTVPPYPYGPRLLYKQSNHGLYGTSRIRHGHNVSEKHHQVTPRTWRPNVHRKRLWSESLGAWVRTRLTTRVLRTVRKEGGIDAYVTKNKAARVKELGPGGWKLRWLVMQTPAFRERYAAERETLGVQGDMPEDQTDLVHYMVDAATPGPLSAVSREILERRASQMIAEEFALGEEAEMFEGGAQYEEVHLDGAEEPAIEDKRLP